MSGRLWLTPWTRGDVRAVPFQKSRHDRAYPERFGLWRHMGQGLGCTRLGWRICYLPSGRWMSLYHRHPDEEEVFCLRRGACVADVEGTAVTLHAGDFLRTPPGVGHQLSNDGPDAAEILTLGAPTGGAEANYPRNPEQRQGPGAQPLPDPALTVVREADIPWTKSRSVPQPERYGDWRRVGEALGCAHLGLRLGRMAPGVALTPYHRHAEQEEIYFVLSGNPTIDIADKHLLLRPDEAVRVPCDVPRRLRNAEAAEALVLCLSAPYVPGDNMVLPDYPD